MQHERPNYAKSGGAGQKTGARGAPEPLRGGDDGDRTHDLRLAKPALSQLSYVPDR